MPKRARSSRAKPKFIGLVSLFPEAFSSLTSYGVVGSALNSDKVRLEYFNPRDYASDKYGSVDDAPYGGGQGMVLKYDTTAKALDAAFASAQKLGYKRPKVLFFSPQGKKLKQSSVADYAAADDLILLSGCYEGVDERIVASYVDEEISIGDYILSSGELAAMVFLNLVVRQWDETLGNKLSKELESFSNNLLEEPHYTRPRALTATGKHALSKEKLEVPDTLCGGNHQAILDWRRQQALGRTWLRRPELLAKQKLSIKDKKLLLYFMGSAGAGVKKSMVK